MLASFLRDPDEPAEKMPHISHSRMNRYLLCPEQYRLYYVEKLRPRVPSASLAFGSIMHQTLAVLFQKKSDPYIFFEESWGLVKHVPLAYKQRENWDKLKESGKALLTKFVNEELPRIENVSGIERPFKLSITGLDVPFIGIIDLVSEVDGKKTVVDFKTAGSTGDDHDAHLSDQLTAYKLAQPQAERLALWVLVKTKEPQILWRWTERSGAQLAEYLAKAGYVAREIAANRFYKRPGMWCAWCDFLPVCLGNQQRTAESLVAVG